MHVDSRRGGGHHRGSQGPGPSHCTGLCHAEAEGAILARCANQLEAAREQIAAVASGRVLPMVCDVSAAADIEGVYEQIQATFRRVDILVNNAGKSQAYGFEDIADEV